MRRRLLSILSCPSFHLVIRGQLLANLLLHVFQIRSKSIEPFLLGMMIYFALMRYDKNGQYRGESLGKDP